MGNPTRVLLVSLRQDDYVLIENLLARSRSTEFKLRRIRDFEAAERALASRNYDICLLGDSQGEESSLELARRTRPARSDAPLLLLTAQDEYRLAEDAIPAGVVNILVKSELSATRLERALSDALDGKRANSDMARSGESGHIPFATEHAELEALKQRTRHLQQMISNVPGMMFRLLRHSDGAIEYVYVSEVCYALFGVFPEQFLNHRLTFGDLVHPDDMPSFNESWGILSGASAPTEWRGRCVLPTGEVKYIQALAFPEPEENGAQPWNGLFYEVTLQVVAEQEAAHLADIVQSSGEAIIGKTLEGVITSWNPAAERLYGYKAAEIVGRHNRCLLPPGQSDDMEDLLRRVARGEAVHDHETVRCAKDGALIDVSLTVSPIRDNHGRVIAAATITHDIRPRKRLEEQLLQAQKLESVGRLAGGVAHDFNNLLTAILGYADLAVDAGQLPPATRKYLDNIILAADSAAGLTRQLLAFARRQVIEPKVLDLNALILSLDNILRRLIGEHIELVMLPEEGLHAVRVDPGQFEQILVNLIVNARDAMPNGGKITIETQNVTLDAEYARHHDEVAPGEYVMLAVSDTGYGIDEAIRLHIFEPFFTTKGKGRGTGLGLATVYGIVKQAGGHIWLYSEPGEGTTFKIYLPRTLASPEAESTEPESAAHRSGGEMVLLVEDEPAVRVLAVQVLHGQGYTVLEAMNGVEALRVAQGREKEIALLITDVIMPQMNGKELAERLQAVHPGLKVLYASGYTENTILHHGVLEPGTAFLSKPFTPAMLVRRVREVLDNGTTDFES